uniref:Acetyl-CoA carboxylase n=1 Tax=Plectus sambesii TaxID=2011161 RepID=A0A914WMT1_9BILA
YLVSATRCGPESYFLSMNQGGVRVEFHNLNDGAMLLSYGTNSYTCYMKEEVDKYVVQIGNKTIILEKENDPTLLRSPSAGKLVSYLVEDGGHIHGGSPYAEVEVMKMIMTLTATESGILHYVKRPGAVLTSGVTIARMVLDDPDRVRRAVPMLDPFPEWSEMTMVEASQQKSQKPHKDFRNLVQEIKDIFNGYSLPEPYFTVRLKEIVDRLFQVLDDPRLPLLELQELMAVVSGRIPLELENAIKKQLSVYAGNITSVLSKFPSQTIANELDRHAAKLTKQERDMFFMTTQGILQLVQRYRSGTRGHMKLVVEELLRLYLKYELYFQVHQYDKCVSLMREQVKDASLLTRIIFSHLRVHKKNALVLALIERINKSERGLISELKDVLTELSSLSKPENGKVALSARQVLISAQQPSYDSRHNQVESIFLSAVDRFGNNYFNPEELEKLISSETSIFDVLHDFFYHSTQAVRMAALEVYVRRAFVSYPLNCLRHHFLRGCGVSVVEFQFTLPSSHPNRNTNKGRGMTRVMSHDDYEQLEHLASIQGQRGAQRVGIIAAFKSYSTFSKHYKELLGNISLSVDAESSDSDTRLSTSSDGTDVPEEPINVVNIAIRVEEDPEDAEDVKLAEKLQKFCITNRALFRERGIRRVTFILLEDRSFPKYFTFRATKDFDEDKIYRNLEPALAFQLEINRMRNYQLEAIPTGNRRHHLYLGRAVQGKEVTDYRFFLRCIIRHADMVSKAASFDYMKDEGERVLLEAIEALEVAMSHPDAHRTDCNHIFLNFVPCVTLDPQRVVDTVRHIIMQYGPRLWTIRVLEAELAFRIRLQQNGQPITMRLTVSNNSGYLLDLTMYQEVSREQPDGTVQTVYDTWNPQGSSKIGRYHGFRINFPYQTKDNLQQKRYAAQKIGTTYAYDFPEMFRQALVKTWREQRTDLQRPRRPRTYTDRMSTMSESDLNDSMSYARLNDDDDAVNAADVLQCQELIIDANGNLMECQRAPGENDCGMVAWKLTMKTPEYPDGREIILIANDITFLIGSFGVREHQLYKQASQLSRQLEIILIANDITFLIGSFGVREHQLYKQASQLSRQLGIPRLYIAANSGARIGLAEEIKNAFKIAWVDKTRPDKGFKYLYLTAEDHKKHSPNAVMCDEMPLEVDGEIRYKIKDIIGKQESLGVENLKGSGLIAGETSEAYRDVITMSLVTCRTVGIGAYVVRLAQRIVQVENAHIILTGAPALNKLLGKEVYTSSGQLGGIQIMHNNGITHSAVKNDFEGVVQMLKWLSYMPKRKGELGPVLTSGDAIERPIEFTPTKAPYDPRCMLAGRINPTQPSVWESGFFDKGSWEEIMSAWAKTVICGRARLGGIPAGVIAVETRTVELEIPADPATADSEAKMHQQAGQVWYPDSAYKTAQAIFDFNREGLPLFIFANWRGFSGGMKDMFDQVMKFGAYIVDGLRGYKQPVFIYIPPFAELRGGAWAVVDPSINSRYMEMYADGNARGGVLEPEGTVEIKYRQRDLLKTIHRLDDRVKELVQLLAAATDEAAKAKLTAELTEREEHLLPLYHTVAVQFADLHDTTGRMLAKGVIAAEVRWRDARKHFYWRLRRRLIEDVVKSEIVKCAVNEAEDSLTSSASLERFFALANVRFNDRTAAWEDDEQVAIWLEEQWADSTSQVRMYVDERKKNAVLDNVRRQLTDKDLKLEALKEMMSNTEFRAEAFKHLLAQLSEKERQEVKQQLTATDQPPAAGRKKSQ